MGKNQVPRGTTKKERCKKCGNPYHPTLIGASMKLTEMCSVCSPEQYSKKKEGHK